MSTGLGADGVTRSCSVNPAVTQPIGGQRLGELRVRRPTQQFTYHYLTHTPVEIHFLQLKDDGHSLPTTFHNNVSHHFSQSMIYLALKCQFGCFRESSVSFPIRWCANYFQPTIRFRAVFFKRYHPPSWQCFYLFRCKVLRIRKSTESQTAFLNSLHLGFH
jgi:hypothetical protein